MGNSIMANSWTIGFKFYKKEKEIHLLRNWHNSTVFFLRVAAKGILALTSSWSHRQKILLKMNKSMTKALAFLQFFSISMLPLWK